MITLEDSQLVFAFPDVHEHARCSIEFQRTLRIPDDGKDYPLPPGFGRFPLEHADDFVERLPEDWSRRAGVIMPMYQSEALWLNFGGGWWSEGDYPFAIKVAAGKINAVTGETWTNQLNADPQDYLVVPSNPGSTAIALRKVSYANLWRRRWARG